VVRQYTDSHYVPAAAAYSERAKDGGKVGADLLKWQREIAAHWQDVRFGSVQIFSAESEHQFEVQVFLGRVDPESVLVEIYADVPDGGQPLRQPMRRGEPLADSAGGYLYSAAVPTDRPVGDYTPRARPAHSGLFLPLEACQILWQR
jgi:starch phosphorylase